MTLSEQLRELAGKATKGDLSTAQRHIAEESVECPFCQGEGEVSATDYCNFDSKALGVQFYGIGNEFGAHEKLWSALTANLETIIAAVELQERLDKPETVEVVARAIWAEMDKKAFRTYARMMSDSAQAVIATLKGGAQ